MADMLVELIQKFIDGSEATLSSLFKSMVNLVFFIERELNTIQVQGGIKIDFNGIYQVVFSYACFILVIVFIAKLIKIYFLQSDGDAERNPIHLIVGMVKAVIVMICCKEVYDMFVGIVSNFLTSILGAMPVKTVSLAEVLSDNIAGGVFTAVACLILLITWLILICQFIMKGIEMLLMRMGIPFSTIRNVKFRWRSISRIHTRLFNDSIYFNSTVSINEFIYIGNYKWTFDLCNSNCYNVCKYTNAIV